MTGEITNKLREIYRKAYEEGIWLREWPPAHGGDMYVAAAGSMNDLERIEKKCGIKIDASKLDLGAIVDISEAGIGKTREEATRNAIKAWKKYVKQNKR